MWTSIGLWSISCSSAFSRAAKAARISADASSLGDCASSAVSWALSGRCERRGG